MSDRIYLRNINVDILVGILPHEKVNKQPVIINVELITDCSAAAKSDDIADAVDYSVIHDEIVEHSCSNQYGLIETLAEKIAALCLEHSAVEKCTVSIDKPEALEYAESVAVEITRSRK